MMGNRNMLEKLENAHKNEEKMTEREFKFGLRTTKN